MSKAYQYYLLYKPFGYLSQFTRELPEHQTLADLCPDLPKDVFPIGRLDQDSEGLLLLSSDPSVNARLLLPSNRHNRTYMAQVEGIPTKEALAALQKGPVITVGKTKHQCLHCVVVLLEKEPDLPARVPPIRVRKSIPDSWIQLTLHEGKNRQVRKMCAAVGYPVLRLVRSSIEGLSLESLRPGDCVELGQQEFYNKLTFNS